MRVSTQLFYQRGTQGMLDQQAELSRTEQQLAAGRRILSPSDDPAGTVRILDLKQYVDTLNQYQDNLGVVEGRLQLQETTLDTATNLMLRAHELAVQGNNSTLSSSDRSALAEEVRQLENQLLALANTRDAGGEYLFAGFQKDTQPFTDLGGGVFRYNGDQGQRTLSISPDRRILDNENGLEIFMGIPTGSGGIQDAFTTLRTLSDTLESGGSLSNSITDVQLVRDHFLDIRARGGARLNTLAQQESANEAYKIAMQTQLSNEEDLDYAEAVSRFNQQLLALQASQQAYIKIQGLSLFNYL